MTAQNKHILETGEGVRSQLSTASLMDPSRILGLFFILFYGGVCMGSTTPGATAGTPNYPSVQEGTESNVRESGEDILEDESENQENILSQVSSLFVVSLFCRVAKRQ